MTRLLAAEFGGEKICINTVNPDGFFPDWRCKLPDFWSLLLFVLFGLATEVSLVTSAPAMEKVKNLTYQTVSAEE